MASDPNNGNGDQHTWRFFRAGGFDQVRLDSGEDLRRLGQLDQKLWMALSCPTHGLEFDEKTLDLIDTDKDGRVRAPEIIAATQWACAMLKEPDELLKGADALPLDAISDATPESKQLLSSARHILANLGKSSASAITLEDTADTARIFAQTRFNGDGIIPADSADDAETRSIIQDIIACLGSELDRSGKPGINQAKVDQFFADLQAHAEWWATAEHDAATVLPLGDATASAGAALQAVTAKIDDYFARCRLAAFDARAQAALNRQESDYLAIAAKDLSITAAEVSSFPLASIEPNKPLPLLERVNPAWAESLARFHAQVVQPLLPLRGTCPDDSSSSPSADTSAGGLARGPFFIHHTASDQPRGNQPHLTEKDWTTIRARFAPFNAWGAAKAGTSVEKLGLPRIRQILTSGAKRAIALLLEQDKVLEAEANAIATVDKLVRYHRDLYRLLNNFVCFRDFYARKGKAIFQTGTLYIDQRSCELCVRVEDMARHGTMAHLSRTYLAYCDLVRKSTGEKRTIAAAFTSGDCDNLMVGRNGIFYDRKGQDWDATIVKLVDNPISIRQAFFAPYKRAIRWVEEQIAKRAAAADAAAQDKLTSAAMQVGNAASTGSGPTQKPKIDIGVVAALGVAVGGITAALGALLQSFFGLGMWMPLGMLALLLAISGPSMLIAWLKLRQRNLGPILDANGWAVNARAKINIAFGDKLTGTAKLPAGAKRNLIDPYAESRSGPALAATAIAAVVACWALWYFGVVERVSPGTFPKSGWVQRGEVAKAASTQPAEAKQGTGATLIPVISTPEK